VLQPYEVTKKARKQHLKIIEKYPLRGRFFGRYVDYIWKKHFVILSKIP
jgi:hypothetical protein